MAWKLDVIVSCKYADVTEGGARFFSVVWARALSSEIDEKHESLLKTVENCRYDVRTSQC